MKVSIIGGGLSGLAAAEESEKQGFDTVIYDQGKYQEGNRRGDWGELILNSDVLPDDIEGIRKEVPEGAFKLENGEEIPFKTISGATIDREKVEVSWAEKLESTVIKEDHYIDQTEFLKIARESDLIIDASGPFPVSRRFGLFENNHENMIKTISANFDGDFSEYDRPIAYPVDKRFLWVNPMDEENATVGVGYLREDFPDNPYQKFVEKCEELNIPEPPLDEIKIGTAPNHKSYNSKLSARLEGADIRLAGNAIGLNNFTTGFGMERSIMSGRLAVKTYNSDKDFFKEIESLDSGMSFQNKIVGLSERVLGLEKTVSILSKVNTFPKISKIMRPETRVQFAKGIIQSGDFRGRKEQVQ